MLRVKPVSSYSGGLAMRRKESEPTYLLICWEETQPNGSVVVFEAFLCLRHRRERFVAHPSAQGRRRLGLDCDLCEGREPRRAPALSVHGTPSGQRSASPSLFHVHATRRQSDDLFERDRRFAARRARIPRPRLTLRRHRWRHDQVLLHRHVRPWTGFRHPAGGTHRSEGP
jgi:hypothetical protein